MRMSPLRRVINVNKFSYRRKFPGYLKGRKSLRKFPMTKFVARFMKRLKGGKALKSHQAIRQIIMALHQ